MLHTCDQRFDVTENLENFCELDKALYIDMCHVFEFFPSGSLNSFHDACCHVMCHASKRMLHLYTHLASSEVRSCLLSPKKTKFFKDSLSHRIFRRMHGVLNIDKNKNCVHSLVEIDEMNLLSLVRQ